MLTSTARLW